MKTEDRARVLRDMAKANKGKLTPEFIVEKASSPDHELHEAFEWDDGVAGHKHRLATARAMIRAVRIEVRIEKRSFKEVPIYVHDPMSAGQSQGYISLEETTRENKRKILLIELERIVSSIRRAQKIAATTMPTVVEPLESGSNLILQIMAQVKRARN